MDEDYLQELFESVGPIQIRKMFGGQGIYVDGTIIAVIVKGALMIKGDAQLAEVYEASGL
ncbi:MAG: TfoX/Sxy family protein [Pseudomonadota bacterium]